MANNKKPTILWQQVLTPEHTDNVPRRDSQAGNSHPNTTLNRSSLTGALRSSVSTRKNNQQEVENGKE